MADMIICDDQTEIMEIIDYATCIVHVWNTLNWHVFHIQVGYENEKDM